MKAKIPKHYKIGEGFGYRFLSNSKARLSVTPSDYNEQRRAIYHESKRIVNPATHEVRPGQSLK